MLSSPRSNRAPRKITATASTPGPGAPPDLLVNTLELERTIRRWNYDKEQVSDINHSIVTHKLKPVDPRKCCLSVLINSKEYLPRSSLV